MAHVDYLIPMDRFDNSQYIDERLAKVGSDVAGALRTTLTYLYLSNGPINLPRLRLKASESYLDPAEVTLARWLQTRTNGSERKKLWQSCVIRCAAAAIPVRALWARGHSGIAPRSCKGSRES